MIVFIDSKMFKGISEDFQCQSNRWERRETLEKTPLIINVCRKSSGSEILLHRFVIHWCVCFRWESREKLFNPLTVEGKRFLMYYLNEHGGAVQKVPIFSTEKMWQGKTSIVHLFVMCGQRNEKWTADRNVFRMTKCIFRRNWKVLLFTHWFDVPDSSKWEREFLLKG